MGGSSILLFMRGKCKTYHNQNNHVEALKEFSLDLIIMNLHRFLHQVDSDKGTVTYRYDCEKGKV